MLLQVMIINLFCLNINVAGSINHSANFHPVSSTACVCPGDVLLYECTIEGAGTTVWRGSAFMTCDYIALLHSQFTPGTGGTCNRGALIASSLRTENGSRYTSQLNVTISRELDQTSVECVHDNGSRLLTVGASKVQLKDSVPPPDGITLSLDRPGWLVFSWSEVVTGCEAVRYRIFASNCGRCPTTTAHTTAVCTDVPTNGNNNCTFAVQTIVCDSVAGNASDPIHALLRVPDAPTMLKVIPRYSYRSGRFSGITVEFNSENLMVNSISSLISGWVTYNEVAGTILSYTFNFANGNNPDSVCGSSTIPATSLCSLGRICRHVFDVNSSLLCPTSSNMYMYIYNVSVFATNFLGKGYTSSIITAITHSINVSVLFDLSSKRVICNFADHDRRNEKTCRISYGPGTECRVWNSTKIVSSSVTSAHSDSVIIGLTSLPNKEPINCFIATLTSGEFIAEIEGTLDTASMVDGTSKMTDHLILVISLGIAIILVTVAISVVIHITIIAVRSRVKGRSSQHPNSTTSSTNRVPTEPPVIYEDLEQVNKDIDLENNMAYSSAHV